MITPRARMAVAWDMAGASAEIRPEKPGFTRRRPPRRSAPCRPLRAGPPARATGGAGGEGLAPRPGPAGTRGEAPAVRHDHGLVLRHHDGGRETAVHRQNAQVAVYLAYAAPAGTRLRTLADVFAFAAACPIRLLLDGSQIQVRRPKAGPARPAGVRVGQEEDEHRQSHRGLRRARADAAGRDAAARPDARPDRAADRRHRRPRPVPRCEMDAGYRACTATARARSVSRPGNQPGTRRPRPPDRGSRHATASHPSGSGWGTRSPIPRTGGPCNAGSADARTCRRPSGRSDPWSLTAPQPGD